MFGRKKDGERLPGQPAAAPVGDEEIDALLMRSANRKAASGAAGVATPTAPGLQETPRRPAATAPVPASGSNPPRPTAPAPAPAPSPAPVTTGEGRKLIVGRDICLRGEVTSCDTLIIEGHVDLALTDARHIQVMSSGVFTGSVDVEEADIAGRFEGELVARDRLIVRSGGQVNGRVRYANIVIEAGGHIAGEIGHMETPSTAMTASAPTLPMDAAEPPSLSPAAPASPGAAEPTGASDPAPPTTAIERAIPLPPRVARPAGNRE